MHRNLCMHFYLAGNSFEKPERHESRESEHLVYAKIEALLKFSPRRVAEALDASLFHFFTCNSDAMQSSGGREREREREKEREREREGSECIFRAILALALTELVQYMLLRSSFP